MGITELVEITLLDLKQDLARIRIPTTRDLDEHNYQRIFGVSHLVIDEAYRIAEAKYET